jgi:hypothetical protein
VDGRVKPGHDGLQGHRIRDDFGPKGLASTTIVCGWNCLTAARSASPMRGFHASSTLLRSNARRSKSAASGCIGKASTRIFRSLACSPTDETRPSTRRERSSRLQPRRTRGPRDAESAHERLCRRILPRMRQFHHGAQRHVPEMRHLRRDNGVLVTASKPHWPSRSAFRCLGLHPAAVEDSGIEDCNTIVD